MHRLSKDEAIEFIRNRVDLFPDRDDAANPFASVAWSLHFLEQIAEPNWTIVIPESAISDPSFMLLYSTAEAPHKLMSLNNYYSSLYSPLIGEATHRANAVEAIIAQLRPQCGSLNLAPLDENSSDVTAVFSELRKKGWYVNRYFCFGNWFLPCDGLSFADYMKARDSKLLNTWTRKAKKFKDGTETRIEVILGPAAVDTAMDAYERIYAKSWKKPEPYPNFVRGWAQICALNGWLRMGLAYVDGTPIATQFWFTINRRAYIFKLAYDEDFAKYSAGTVLTAELMRHSLEVDRVIEIDYLTGDDAYKRAWMNNRRERIGLLACNLKTIRGCVAAVPEVLGQLRRRVRRV